MEHRTTGLRPVSAGTANLPERDKFAYWNEVICRTVVDLDCRPIEQPSFDASIGGFDAPGIGVYDIHTRAHLVYRDKTQIARLDSEALVINYVTSGQLYSEQDGHAVRLEAGDGAVSDAARPYFLQFDQPLGCVSVKVYKSDLASRVTGVERIAATSLRQRSSLTPLVVGYMTQLIAAAPTLERAAGLQAAEVFKDLLGASLNEVILGTTAASCENRAVTLLRVKSYVDKHLTDPDLNPAKVAAALGFSTRYINRLFEAEQSSLMRHLWHRRLDWCARRISTSAGSRASLTDIAFAAGFNDLSHFSRCFKARFGRSPRAFREELAKGSCPTDGDRIGGNQIVTAGQASTSAVTTSSVGDSAANSLARRSNTGSAS